MSQEHSETDSPTATTSSSSPPPADNAEDLKPYTDETKITPLTDPLDFVRNAVYSYLPAHIKKRWCEGSVHGLRFTDSGMARACQIFGWITGVAASPDKQLQDFAAKAARDICEQFDWLTGYGGHHVDPFKGQDPNPRRFDAKTPRYIVELGDDGCFSGFTVLWLVAVHPDNQAPVAAMERFDAKYDDVCQYSRGPAYRYTRSMNGGLLYSGPAAGEQWAVNLTSTKLWSIHT